MLRSINPATLDIVSETAELTQQEIDHKITQADAAFHTWRHRSFAERALLMKKAANHLRDEKEKCAEIMSLEVGKTISGATAEVEKSALVCDYYAEHAAHFLKNETIPTDAHQSYVRFDPLGPVVAIMPWNFPLWQVFRFAAPALMAGNVGVLKHASNVPQCALAIEEVFTKAGFPLGAFQTVLVPGAKALALIDDARIAAVTLTGSEEAGARVAEASG